MLSPTAYMHNIKLESDTFRQFRFGIAVEVGSWSSGITWSSCTYNTNSGMCVSCVCGCVCTCIGPIGPLSVCSVSPVCPVCDVGVLWPNGWTDPDETSHAGRPQPWPHCVRWGPRSPSPKGAQPLIFGRYLLWPNGSMDQDATW